MTIKLNHAFAPRRGAHRARATPCAASNSAFDARAVWAGASINHRVRCVRTTPSIAHRARVHPSAMTKKVTRAIDGAGRDGDDVIVRSKPVEGVFVQCGTPIVAS